MMEFHEFLEYENVKISIGNKGEVIGISGIIPPIQAIEEN
jgi:hypothetical protein